MSLDTKKRKKPQVLETETQPQDNEVVATDSTESINKEVIKILKKGEVKMRHAIIVSDEKLTKFKKEIVKETAEAMEEAGYPVEKICYVIKRLWCPKRLVGERTVEEALDEKYKDAEQSRVGKMGGIHGGRKPRAQQPKGPKSQDIKQLKDQAKEIEDLKKTIKELKQVQRRNWVGMREFWLMISDPNFPDNELVERIRENAKATIDFFNSEIKQLDLDLGKGNEPKPESKSKTQPPEPKAEQPRKDKAKPKPETQGLTAEEEETTRYLQNALQEFLNPIYRNT